MASVKAPNMLLPAIQEVKFDILELLLTQPEEIESLETIATVLQGKISDLKEQQNKKFIATLKHDFDISASVLPRVALGKLFRTAWKCGFTSIGGVSPDDKAKNLYWKGSTVYEKSDKTLTDALDTLYINAWRSGFLKQRNRHSPEVHTLMEAKNASMETTIYGEAVKMLEKQFPFKH